MSRPPRIFSSVDFPLPDGPRMTTNSDWNKSRVTPRRAWTSTSPMRYTLVRSRASNTGDCGITSCVPLRGDRSAAAGGRLEPLSIGYLRDDDVVHEAASTDHRAHGFFSLLRFEQPTDGARE